MQEAASVTEATGLEQGVRCARLQVRGARSTP